jgi:hypothetical protein
MPESDDEVIPLSRWRAALARARRTRRADAILAEPDAAQLVPRLPVQELFYAIKEVGLADARELVALASPEQIRGFLDLDVWHKDHLDEATMTAWLDAVVDAGPEKLASVLEALDAEAIALYMQRQATVYDLQLDQPPEQPEGHYYPTHDRFFLLDILVEGERGKALERLIDWLYRADLSLARRVMMSAKWELASDLEEWCYRWRSGRMADLGYAEFYEALSVYRYLDPTSVRIDEGSVSAERGVSTLPMQLAGSLDEQSFFARALATVADEREIERLHGQLMTLVNRVMAADLIEPGDVEGARHALGRAVGYLAIGLEYLARSDLGRAGQALRAVALERIFRLGVSLTLQLHQLAETLWQKGRVRLGASDLLLDPPLDALIEALRQARPVFPAELDSPPGSGPRPFLRLADIRRAVTALEEAAQLAPLVWDLLGVALPDAAVAIAGSTTVEPRFGTLVRTLAAHLLLDEPATVMPFDPERVPALLERAQRPDARATVEAGLRQLADGRAEGALPAAFARWLERWLSDLPAQLAGPSGLLVRMQ